MLCLPQMKNQSAKGADVVSVAGAIDLGKERGIAIASVAKANSCQENDRGPPMVEVIIVDVMLPILFLKI